MSGVEPEFTDETRHIWVWYLDLIQPERLTYQEIDAWARLTGTFVEAWEVTALMAMDKARASSKVPDYVRHEQPEMQPATAETIKELFRRRMKKPGQVEVVDGS